MRAALLDPENTEAMVWADSANRSKRVDSFLKMEMAMGGKLTRCIGLASLNMV